ncbi:DUF1656 domain-containing protein [Shewanella maritima]|uniref:DUF1656 domain-containing protein n=1 Tax=Shewanella maritima TaxID=2520507 RepID=UPI003735B083
MPYEFTLGEVYFPPLLIVALMAYVLANILTEIGAKLGLYQLVAMPALFELSLFVLLVAVIGYFLPFA